MRMRKKHSRPFDPDREVLSLDDEQGRTVMVAPRGLEFGYQLGLMSSGVTLEQLRAACDRYSARKTTVPGSYANRHYVETGHAFGFGCCVRDAA